MNKCRRCGEYREPEWFRERKDRGTRMQVCKPCENSANLKRFHGNPATKTAHRLSARRHVLKRYGLTEAAFNKMREDQQGRCAICSVHEEATRFGTLCVDHSHTTGLVRGLLCQPCNSGIAFLGEDPAVFGRAVSYVEGRL